MAVPQGTDITRRIEILKNGQPVSIPSLHELHVYVYTMVNHRKKLFATFKKSATGEYAIEIDPDQDNRFIMVLNRNQNRNELGQIYIEIATQADADSKYPDSLKNNGKTGIEFEFLEPSADPDGLM